MNIIYYKEFVPVLMHFNALHVTNELLNNNSVPPSVTFNLLNSGNITKFQDISQKPKFGCTKLNIYDSTGHNNNA
jgi:hypothetical protein